MSAQILDVLSWVLLLSGSFFCVVTGIGLNRMPDFYTRNHAAGIADTLGLPLILLGLALQVELPPPSEWMAVVQATGHVPGGLMTLVKLLMIMLFIYLTSPTACHALVQAAYASGVKADPGPRSDA